MLSIDRVGFTRQATLAFARRAGDLADRVFVTPQEPSKPGPIRSAAFDPEGVEIAEALSPGQHVGIAVRVGWEESWFVDDTAKAVDDLGDAFVFVGVDPDDDIGAFECNAGHWLLIPSHGR